MALLLAFGHPIGVLFDLFGKVLRTFVPLYYKCAEGTHSSAGSYEYGPCLVWQSLLPHPPQAHGYQSEKMGLWADIKRKVSFHLQIACSHAIDLNFYWMYNTHPITKCTVS